MEERDFSWALQQLKAANGVIVPWLASQTDLLADDWDLVQ